MTATAPVIAATVKPRPAGTYIVWESNWTDPVHLYNVSPQQWQELDDAMVEWNAQGYFVSCAECHLWPQKAGGESPLTETWALSGAASASRSTWVDPGPEAEAAWVDTLRSVLGNGITVHKVSLRRLASIEDQLRRHAPSDEFVAEVLNGLPADAHVTINPVSTIGRVTLPDALEITATIDRAAGSVTATVGYPLPWNTDRRYLPAVLTADGTVYAVPASTHPDMQVQVTTRRSPTPAPGPDAADAWIGRPRLVTSQVTDSPFKVPGLVRSMVDGALTRVEDWFHDDMRLKVDDEGGVALDAALDGDVNVWAYDWQTGLPLHLAGRSDALCFNATKHEHDAMWMDLNQRVVVLSTVPKGHTPPVRERCFRDYLK